MEAILKDLRFGLRQLRLNPTFTIVSVASLALGIGANTAIFQLVDAVRLRTLPVQNPQELVAIEFPKGSQRSGWFSTRYSILTYTQWELIRDQQKAFTGAAAWSPTRFNLTQGGEARYAEGLYISGDFFGILGVPAVLGRTFTKEEDKLSCDAP